MQLPRVMSNVTLGHYFRHVVERDDSFGAEIQQGDEDEASRNTFAPYCSLNRLWPKHIGTVVETALLSSVERETPKLDVKILQDATVMGNLSDLQVDTFVCASHTHNTKIGDGRRIL